jgi:hypothetical protein
LRRDVVTTFDGVQEDVSLFQMADIVPKKLLELIIDAGRGLLAAIYWN